MVPATKVLVDDDANPSATEAAESGYLLEIADEAIPNINLRVLSKSNGLTGNRPNKSIFVPSEYSLELLFFRRIFIRLREQVPEAVLRDDEDENIPTEIFQRAFERLFHVLKDAQGFSSKVYDQNRNGYVGWGEFCYVYKNRKVKIHLTFCERLFLLFDNSDSCVAAQFISNLVLLVIITSSLCFILSTVPRFQVYPEDGSQPLPDANFKVVEAICLACFVCEYVVRVSTCWAVRSEVFDQARLLDITTGYDVVHSPSPLKRLLMFMLTPSNLVDLAAILPGVIGTFIKVNGGGFVVLRLIRLTRIFRALKHIRGPAVVLARTIQSSLKAFFVLAFNLALVIVISGSLMYLAEGGKWDPETRTYQRVHGRFWNSTLGDFQDGKRESPFLSIPHAFWWSVVTAVTVGYGDYYPTTSVGYVIAVATMVMSIVILALPVGVIGGNFQQKWEHYEEEAKTLVVSQAKEIEAITSAIQTIDPFSMSSLMLIEVWNDRFPQDAKKTWSGPDVDPVIAAARRVPLDAEFMGQCVIPLELSQTTPQSKQVRMPLLEDDAVCKRPVAGYVSVRYEWTPREVDQATMEGCSTENGDGQKYLFGTLLVTVVAGEKLINLDLHSLHSASNPFCTVLMYPTSPRYTGEVVRPVIWRGPTLRNSLSPQWHSSEEFEFAWHTPQAKPKAAALSFDSDGGLSASMHCLQEAKFNEVLTMLESLMSEVRSLKEDVKTVSKRVNTIRECS
eukprot:TRINITY_DN80827_c0_g1_i1.p1 TRINITY_DN80827_c0_g1~~TRINITY_DN80827_c0_g1_i1.p1  ORF type:complete len:732 (-),score=142.73 TRINITY_DN80827_c0_g1_i1:57-2252(-)